jgi:hypothetical protein
MFGIFFVLAANATGIIYNMITIIKVIAEATASGSQLAMNNLQWSFSIIVPGRGMEIIS